jgi:L-aminopeptidase/D-esterase-like protein
MKNPEMKITDMSVQDLQRLIRETVQEAVAEVIVEFSVAVEAEEKLRYEAEMADILRSSLHGLTLAESLSPNLDD